MDMSQYRGLFVSEAREHVRNLGSLTLLMERDPGNRDQVDALFRAAHSIKGMAASMEFRRIADLAHHLEDLMDRVRKGFPVDEGLTELLLTGSDTLETMIGDVETGEPDGRPADDLVQRIDGYISGSARVPLPPAEP